MNKRMLWAMIGFLLLLPMSFGGFTLSCNDEEDQDIGDAVQNLIDEVEDAF